MDFKSLALSFDALASPVEAAWAYEIALNESGAELELFLNLAVLYFESVDFGYASRHNLSEQFTSAAWHRAFDVLRKAEERFGSCTEIEFWRLYFSFIYGGDKSIEGACKELAQKKDSLVPFLYLFSASGKKDYFAEAKQLLGLVNDGNTERKRYIKSIIESNVIDIGEPNQF